MKQPGFLWKAMIAGGRFATRNPRALGVGLCLGVTCSFVVANALWYQPGGHPHPFFKTRDPQNPDAIAGYRPASHDVPGDVTTFHIERQAEPPAVLPVRPAQQPSAEAIELPQSTATTSAAPVTAERQHSSEPLATPPAPDAQQKLAGLPPAAVPKVKPSQRPVSNTAPEDPVAAAIRASENGAAPRPPGRIPNANNQAAEQPVPAKATRADQIAAKPTNASVGTTVDLVMQIQRGLVNIAYTDVTIDGVAGAQTRAAIRHFQKHYRLPENGEPSEVVLKKLQSIGAL